MIICGISAIRGTVAKVFSGLAILNIMAAVSPWINNHQAIAVKVVFSSESQLKKITFESSKLNSNRLIFYDFTIKTATF